MKIIATFTLILLLSFNVLAIENRENSLLSPQQQTVQINTPTTYSQKAHASYLSQKTYNAVELTSTDKQEELLPKIIICLLIIMVYWIYWYRMGWF